MSLATLAPSPEERLPHQPLALTIPEPTRENVVLRGLLRQAVPMLQHPEGYSLAARRQLAEALGRALEPASSDLHPFEEAPPPYTDADAPKEYKAGCDDWEGLS